MEEERTSAADVERELRRLERVRRRERAARRRALRTRLLPVAAAATIAVVAAAVGIVLVTGATHPRHAAKSPDVKPAAKPRARRTAASPSRRRQSTLPARPTVTLIGDSVADEIAYLASARALVGDGVRLRLDVAACRRLSAASCTVAGYRPQTALELVRARGHSLGQVAIVAVGYNDYELTFGHDVRQVLAALHRAGVQRVLWLTLRANHHSYLSMNDTLRELAAHTSWLTLVDWNRYSRSHPDWFEADGLHLTHEGATAMARLLHRTLAALPRSTDTSS